MLNPSEIEVFIREKLADADIEIRDMTGGGDHFEIHVASAAFANRSTIEQHRLVYSALSDLLQGPLHAVKLNTSVKK